MWGNGPSFNFIHIVQFAFPTSSEMVTWPRFGHLSRLSPGSQMACGLARTMRLHSGVPGGRWWEREDFCLCGCNWVGITRGQCRERGWYWVLVTPSEPQIPLPAPTLDASLSVWSVPGTGKASAIHPCMGQLSPALPELTFQLYISALCHLEPESPGFYFLTYKMDKTYLFCWDYCEDDIYKAFGIY